MKPTNYVAGLGRGAVGFLRRSDIGPAREAANTAPGGGLQGMQGPGAMPPPPPMPGMQGLGPGQHGPERTDYGQAPEGYVAGMGRGMGDKADRTGRNESYQRKISERDGRS